MVMGPIENDDDSWWHLIGHTEEVHQRKEVHWRHVPDLSGSFCDISLVGSYVCEPASFIF
jgi:hypothetical protein